MNKLTHQM